MRLSHSTIIDEMNQEATRRDYLALSVCVGFPDGSEKLIHFCDQDRREQFEQAMNAGATPVGMFFIFHCEYGYVAGARPLVKDKTWDHIFERETHIMSGLLTNDPAFRGQIAERNPRIH